MIARHPEDEEMQNPLSTSPASGMKGLAVFTDQPPYPPRNGITMTVFNYIEHLMKHHAVVVVLLVGENAVERDSLEASRSYYGDRMIELAYQRRSVASRMMREMLGREMYNHGWRMQDGQRMHEALLQAAVRLIAPESAVQKYRCLRLPPAARTVVSINDCVAAEYRFRWKQYGGGVLRRLRSRLDWLRSFRIAGIEGGLLSFADVVCLQTDSDCAHYRRLVGSRGQPAVCDLPNGACPELLSLAVDGRERTDLLFIADLSTEHGHWLDWFLREVYPLIERDTGFARLLVVGRSPAAGLKALMTQCTKVEYRECAGNLAEVYRRVRVVLSLVYKGYGLITKTLDGMAAGCIVVGGDGAFNGIQGFEHRKQGFVVKKGDAAGMAAIIRQCFEPGYDMDVVGANARNLVAEQFRWEDTFRKLEQVLFADPSVLSSASAGLGRRAKKPGFA